MTPNLQEIHFHFNWGHTDLPSVMGAYLGHADLIRDSSPISCDDITFKHLQYSLGWAYMPILFIGHDDLSNSPLVEPIVSSIDLISSL